MARHVSTRADRMQGLIIPWLFASDVSTYPDQAEPQPGTADATDYAAEGWLVTSGGQGQTVYATPEVAGYPGKSRFSVLTEDATILPSVLIPANDSISWFQGLPDDRTDASTFWAAVSPKTQALLCSGSIYNETTGRFDELTIPNPSEADGAVAVADGRFVVFTGGYAYLVDSDGTELGKVGVNPTPSTFDRGFTASRKFCAYGNGAILVILESSVAGEYLQAVSYDLGSTWHEVEYETGTDLNQFGVASLPDGGFVVTHIPIAGADYPEVRIISEAGSPLSAADTVVPQGTYAQLNAFPVVHPDGTIAVVGRRSDNFGVAFTESRDGGATWDDPELICSVSASPATVYTRPFAGVIHRGALTLVCKYTGTLSGHDDKPHVLQFGGWFRTRSMGANQNQAGTNTTRVYLPYDHPHNLGWTLTGSAGALAIVNNTWGYQWNLVAAQGYESRNYTDQDLLRFKCKVVSGGSLLSDAVSAYISTGAYTITLRFTTTGYAIYEGANLVATVTLDMTNAKHFAIYIAGAQARVLHWALGESEVDATETVVTLNPSVAAATVEWGHRALSIAESWWFFVYSGSPAGVSDTDTSFTFQRPVPLPKEFDDPDGNACYLWHRFGPSVVDDLADEIAIAPRYRYAFDNACVDVDPTSGSEWRSEDTTEQTIEFTAPASYARRFGYTGAPSLYVRGANFRTCYLDRWDGAAWVNGVVTLDLGQDVSGTAFARTGATVTPGAGINAAGYKRIGELAGAWLHLDGTDAIRVAGNSPGYFSDTVTPKCVITLDAADLTGVATSGTLAIVRTEGLAVAFDSAVTTATKWRIRIPAQDCPDSYFKASTLIAGYFLPFGRQWSSGYAVDVETNVETIEQPDGSEIRNQLGGLGVTWSLNWQDGYSSYHRDSTPAYVGTSTVPLVTRNDVHTLIRGILANDLRSGSIPVVAVNDVTAAGSETDPDTFLYGYLSGFGFTNVGGYEKSATEYQRGDTLTVTRVR